jgi:hypothetical protein
MECGEHEVGHGHPKVVQLQRKVCRCARTGVQRDDVSFTRVQPFRLSTASHMWMRACVRACVRGEANRTCSRHRPLIARLVVHRREVHQPHLHVTQF